MQQAIEIKLKGRLGDEQRDLQDMRVLNKILRIRQRRLLYEPDPRHAELFATDLDFETLVKYIDRFLMFYVRTADRL